MSKKTTDQRAETLTKAKQPVDLKDDELEKVQGGGLTSGDPTSQTAGVGTGPRGPDGLYLTKTSR